MMHKIEQSVNKALWYVLEEDANCFEIVNSEMKKKSHYFIKKVYHTKKECESHIKRVEALYEHD